MTMRLAEARPGSIPWHACLPFIVAAGAYLVVLASGQALLGDPDSYWHIVVGRWIVENRTFPTVDPFSFTFAGEHWIAKEWLSQLLYAGAYALAGWAGMVVLAAAAVAVAFGLLMRWLEAELSPTASLACLAVAFLLVAPHLTARPHVLALPVMIAWACGVVRAADRREAPPLYLLPLMVLWANLHGGFTLGIVLAGLAGLDALAAAPRADRARTALVWLRFGVLTLVAACITPYGPESMLVTVRILGIGDSLGLIGEWRPQDFSRLGTFEIILLAAFAAALWRGVRLPPVRILAVIGILHLALSAERNGELLGLILPIFLAAPIARQFPRLAGASAGRLGPAGALVAAAIITALVPATLAIASAGAFRPAARIAPEAAVAALRHATSGPILNSYDFGGYLIGQGIPTFIDGRTELYGAAFVRRYHNAVTLADLDDLLTILEDYRIEATLLWPGTPAIAFLDRLPGWKRIHADRTAIVHVRAASP